MTIPSIEEIINVFNKCALISRLVSVQFFRKKFEVELKEDKSPVIEADKAIEQEIRKTILGLFPEHGIIGEEFEDVNEGAKYLWTIDPIDGTKSFLAGRSLFCTLMSFCVDGKPVASMIYQPIQDEKWIGLYEFLHGDKKVTRAIFNSEPISTRKCNSLSEAMLATTGPEYFKKDELEYFNKIASKMSHVLYGGDSYNYGCLASGNVDIVIESNLKRHDFLALAPIIKAAGGSITTWDGKEIDINSDGTVLAVGDPSLSVGKE